MLDLRAVGCSASRPRSSPRSPRRARAIGSKVIWMMSWMRRTRSFWRRPRGCRRGAAPCAGGRRPRRAPSRPGAAPSAGRLRASRRAGIGLEEEEPPVDLGLGRTPLDRGDRVAERPVVEDAAVDEERLARVGVRERVDPEERPESCEMSPPSLREVASNSSKLTGGKAPGKHEVTRAENASAALSAGGSRRRRRRSGT